MDTLLISTWGTAALLIIIFRDPNVPEYIQLRIRQALQRCYALLLSYRFAASLLFTRRSFRNDWLGLRLRYIELRSIQRNPAYREFFESRPESLQKGKD